MSPNIDLYRAATLLVKQHGAEAGNQVDPQLRKWLGDMPCHTGAIKKARVGFGATASKPFVDGPRADPEADHD